MSIKVVGTLFILASVAIPILIVQGSTSDADKELEDEEQMKWLEEWRNRKGKIVYEQRRSIKCINSKCLL